MKRIFYALIVYIIDVPFVGRYRGSHAIDRITESRDPYEVLALVRKGMNRKLRNSSTRTHIVKPPGSRLRGVLEWIYREKTMRRVFEPALADMQNEWLKAVIERRKLKAEWIRVRGYHSIYCAVGLHVVVSAGRKLLSIWKITK